MDYLQYEIKNICNEMVSDVLNLIINGLPSILTSFGVEKTVDIVLNLIINGLPSILKKDIQSYFVLKVLNLIINGLPSILNKNIVGNLTDTRFKPYYKWITFNTLRNYR